MTHGRVAAIVSLIPIAAALAFVAAFGVDFPRHDDWNLIPGIAVGFDGLLEFAHLWTPANEHVGFFPHVLIALLALATRWNLHVQMFASFAFMLGAFVFLARTLLRVEGLTTWSLPLAAAAMFSLHAVDTWLWACQIHVAMAVFGAIGALALLGGDRLRSAPVTGAVLLGIVASWSFLTGFLVWPAGGLVLALRPAERPRRLATSFAWLAGTAVALGVPSLFQPGWPPAPSAQLPSYGRIPGFVARYLGAGLLGSGADAAWADAVGWAAIAAVVAGGAWIAARRRSSAPALVIVAIGVFGVASGALIALGRLWDTGFENAAASRYASFSAAAWVLILALPGLAGAHLPRSARAVAWLLAGAAAVALLVSQPSDLEAGRQIARERRAAAAALRSGEGISWDTLRAASTTDLLGFLEDRVAVLRRYRLSFFRNASPDEISPPPGPAVLSAKLLLANGEEPRGDIEVTGGVPGNLIYVVFASDQAQRAEALVLDSAGTCRATIPAGPAPATNASVTVYSIDRACRRIQSPRTPASR
jgi:hypothetical protein